MIAFNSKHLFGLFQRPLPWKGLPSAARRGWLSLLAAEPPPPCLPHRGRGTAPAVDRVLSLIVDLRRFLFHLYRLLETIPLALFHTARTLSAPSGHLPLEGKADDTRLAAAHKAFRQRPIYMRRSRHHISLPRMGKGDRASGG